MRVRELRSEMMENVETRPVMRTRELAVSMRTVRASETGNFSLEGLELFIPRDCLEPPMGCQTSWVYRKGQV